MLTTAQLDEAWKVVDEASLPDDLRGAALREVLRSIGAGAGAAGRPHRSPEVKGKNSGEDSRQGGSISERAMLEEVARQTDVAVEQLEKLVMLEDGELRLVLGNKDVAKRSNREGARIVARLLTVIGLHGLGRADTPFELIRSECERLKVYDSKNFTSNHLKDVEGFAVRGTGNARRLEARSQGLRAFPDLVTQLLGDS